MELEVERALAAVFPVLLVKPGRVIRRGLLLDLCGCPGVYSDELHAAPSSPVDEHRSNA